MFGNACKKQTEDTFEQPLQRTLQVPELCIWSLLPRPVSSEERLAFDRFSRFYYTILLLTGWQVICHAVSKSMVCLVGFQCRNRLNISIISEHDSLLCCLGKPSCTQVPTTLTLLECCWRRRSNIMFNTISGKAFNFCGKWIWFEWCMR